MKTLHTAVMALAAVLSLAAQAAFPTAYAPVEVQPQVSASGQYEFDLRPAQQRARREGKALYVYLGASDCPYCRKYEQFLAANLRELVPRFAPKYLVVDLRSQLSVTDRQLILRTEALRLPYADFQRAIGDQRARLLVYPSVWLLDAASGKPLMQMPAGAGTFQTVPEQIEILDLVE
ncbi:thioredoxin family protein [uncultured Sphaerotilus sp.]|uniref:thioredoxin family protein n=1 Tax=uncultured Sphaerotilus sp. TaxID=474984 RepID=UPI0030CA1E19